MDKLASLGTTPFNIFPSSSCHYIFSQTDSLVAPLPKVWLSDSKLITNSPTPIFCLSKNTFKIWGFYISHSLKWIFIVNFEKYNLAQNTYIVRTEIYIKLILKVVPYILISYINLIIIIINLTIIFIDIKW